MQKLSKRTNTYTPTDTPQVRMLCDSVLNISKGRRSVQNSKTFDNSSDEDHQQCRAGLNLRVSSVCLHRHEGVNSPSCLLNKF